MSDFMESCVSLYSQLADIDVAKLKKRETPFTTENSEGGRAVCQGTCSKCGGACCADAVRGPLAATPEYTADNSSLREEKRPPEQSAASPKRAKPKPKSVKRGSSSESSGFYVP